MISVCCCIFNAKYDVAMLIEACQQHSKGEDFEIICTHDDRVDDGSSELFAEISRKYSNVHFVTHTEQDTIRYMSNAIDYYERNSIFNESIRHGMRENLQKYINGTWLNKSRDFLWQSSGILYNKAVQASHGDVLLITPGDFLYMFNLGDLERYVKANSISSLFYGSPPAVWARITNMDPQWLTNHINEIYQDASKAPPAYRWDSYQTFRDYLRYPPKLEDLNLCDFRHNRLINLTDNNAVTFMQQFSNEALHQGGVQCNPAFHGYHIMTRATYERIGGFTEEWIHRAFPDDKMTTLGNQLAYREIPAHYAVAWIGNGELLPGHGPGYSIGWQDKLPQIDSWWGKHPVPPNETKRYLFEGYVNSSTMVDMVNRSFSRQSKPVRLGI